MQFEILNTIMFVFYALVFGLLVKVYNNLPMTIHKLKWKYYALIVVIVAVICHNTFYTLTVKASAVQAQNIMSQYSDNKVKELDNYLSSRIVQSTEYLPEDLANRVKLENEKNVQIIENLENKLKENLEK